jgi:ribosomal protein S7
MVHQVVKKKHLKGSPKFYPYKLFIGLLTVRGGRLRGQHLTARLFIHVRRQYRVHPLIFFRAFFEKFRPKVFLYAKRIAGITYKIPVPISYRKSVSILLHWWIALAEKHRRGRPFFPAFLHELDMAYKYSNNNLARKRDEVHKLAHFNRPFLRYLRF